MQYIFIFLFAFSTLGLLAQNDSGPDAFEDAAVFVALEYGYDLSSADLRDRFGNNYEIGSKVSYLFKNSSWQAGLQATYLFGDTVKQDVLAHLRDENGHVLGINGDYAQVKLRQRGFTIGAFVSKIIPMHASNPRSGIRIDLGVHFMQHWIRLQDDYNTVAQFDDPYYKGLDRLTGGLGLTQFLGYHYTSKNRRWNVYAGLNLSQNWTQSWRDYDFATQSSLDEKRLDLLSGVKIGWILPIFIDSNPDEIYY